jgi:hypothetical protein
MNVFLWVLQGLLALLYVSGGAYKIFKVDQLTGYREFSRGTWQALGALELAGGIFLILPGSLTGIPMLNGVAALVLALETIAVMITYARHSTRMKAANPFVWALAQGAMALVVAYGRV